MFGVHRQHGADRGPPPTKPALWRAERVCRDKSCGCGYWVVAGLGFVATDSVRGTLEEAEELASDMNRRGVSVLRG